VSVADQAVIAIENVCDLSFRKEVRLGAAEGDRSDTQHSAIQF
jgi:hypothetical protein